jgi:adenine nucleotide transporter 17
MSAAQEAAVEAVAGAIGSVIGVGLTYPLTTISTWQALDHTDEEKAEVGPGAAAKPGLQLPTPLREIRAYSRAKGWAALFGGVRPCLAATAVSQAAYFYLYSALRHAVVARNNSRGTGDAHTAAIGVAGSLLVAGLSGAGCVLLTNPAWVVATQMLANAKSSDTETRQLTTAQVVRRTYEESGLAGFWKGLFPALVMVGNPTLQYILYERLTGRLLELRRAAAAAAAPAGSRKAPAHARLATSDVFVLTAMAKCGATLLTYPMLLVKSRLQAMNKRTEEGAQYAGVRDAVARILQAEGFGGFFKGMQLKMIQTVLSAALLMTIKERLSVGVRAALLAKPKH